MARIFRALIVLLVVAFVAVVGYAYLGDMSPVQTETRQPVTLDVGP
jgi:hypothetical protein